MYHLIVTNSLSLPGRSSSVNSHFSCSIVDKEISPEKQGDINEHSTDDKSVERISYTKVVHCVMESMMMFIYGFSILMDN